MSGQEQPEPFGWALFRNDHGDWVEIARSREDAERFRGIPIPVARLAEFEAFVRQIREEVAGGN